MKTILLADDSITIQKVVELTFSDGDYRVFCVANGAQALRKIPEIRPDVVLLDVVMPEKNGYEVCEALRADPATASIPVLLLTGTFEPFDRARAEAAGARGHVTKPFESHTLVQRVEELLAQPAARAPAAPAAAMASPRPAPAGAGAGAPATFAGAQRARETGSDPAPPMPPPVEAAAARPSFAAPAPDPGGAYLGFADLAIGEEETVVRDRFDEMETPSSATPAEDTAASPEGFVSGYDLPESPASPRDLRAAPMSSSRRPAPVALSPDMPEEEIPAAPAGGDVGSLSPEMLDRLADLVVRRMSERVVREIAWEVIPGVAETVVRERIKELEDREG